MKTMRLNRVKVTGIADRKAMLVTAGVPTQSHKGGSNKFRYDCKVDVNNYTKHSTLAA